MKFILLYNTAAARTLLLTSMTCSNKSMIRHYLSLLHVGGDGRCVYVMEGASGEEGVWEMNRGSIDGW